MMRRIIAHLLIFTVLVTNVAWAVDDCFSPYGNDDSALFQSGDLSGDSLNNSVCDEFCAGWLHLVAIAQDTKFDYFPFTRQDVVRTNLSYHSLDQTSPFRPPQI